MIKHGRVTDMDCWGNFNTINSPYDYDGPGATEPYHAEDQLCEYIYTEHEADCYIK
jgi:hypothetical protein